MSSWWPLPSLRMAVSPVLFQMYQFLPQYRSAWVLRPGPVWIGVTVAFGVQCLVAVAAGRLIALLPHRPVQPAMLLLVVRVSGWSGPWLRSRSGSSRWAWLRAWG